MSYRERISPRR
ncbi:hypothetical protein ID866_5330 [Astraeus odoratus]|nr:hypothetical protein ID866_5330 [Astraeus odoratus]